MPWNRAVTQEMCEMPKRGQSEQQLWRLPGVQPIGNGLNSLAAILSPRNVLRSGDFKSLSGQLGRFQGARAKPDDTMARAAASQTSYLE